MRTACRFALTIALCTCLAGIARERAQAGNIEAVRGKKYKITKKHGPWMIMVASFDEPPPSRRSKDGLTPQQAADELVYELRTKGIPAYTFTQADVREKIKTRDRRGRIRRRTILARDGQICVLAGNYKSIDSDVGQKTLEYIKGYFPEFLKKKENGGIFRSTPGRPKPLSRAFMTLNPLLSPEEVARRKRKPLLRKLNTGIEHSLLQNPGRYTLVVKSFRGKSVAGVPKNRFDSFKKKFQIDSTLDEAAMNAWQLAQMLREGNLPLRGGFQGQQNFEAYVWHDRYQSVVTVGAFDSPGDPRIKHLARLFGAKTTKNPRTGEQVLAAEALTMPIKGAKSGARKSFIFDPQPRLIEVPRLGSDR